MSLLMSPLWLPDTSFQPCSWQCCMLPCNLTRKQLIWRSIHPVILVREWCYFLCHHHKMYIPQHGCCYSNWQHLWTFRVLEKNSVWRFSVVFVCGVCSLTRLRLLPVTPTSKMSEEGKKEKRKLSMVHLSALVMNRNGIPSPLASISQHPLLSLLPVLNAITWLHRCCLFSFFFDASPFL